MSSGWRSLEGRLCLIAAQLDVGLESIGIRGLCRHSKAIRGVRVKGCGGFPTEG